VPEGPATPSSGSGTTRPEDASGGGAPADG
jgi:hypothetical protein